MKKLGRYQLYVPGIDLYDDDYIYGFQAENDAMAKKRAERIIEKHNFNPRRAELTRIHKVRRVVNIEVRRKVRIK